MRSIIIGILLLFSVSCSEDDLDLSEFGTGFGLKNGTLWSPTIIRATENNRGQGIDIQFNVFDENEVWLESLSVLRVDPDLAFRQLLTNQGSQSGDSTVGGYRTIVDGDIQGDSYDVIIGDDSYIRIIEYNESRNHIEGEINVHFVLSKDSPFSDSPDTLIFEEFIFDALIRD